MLLGFFLLLRLLLGGNSVDHKELDDLQLDLLGATLDGLLWLHDFAHNINYALIGDAADVLDHLLGRVFALEGTGLEG